MEGSYERQNDTGSHRKPTKSYQVRALFLKSASLKSRQPLSICCNLICPSIMVSLIGIIGLIIGSLVGNISNEVNTSYPNQINDYELQQRLGSMWLMFANADGYPAAGQLTANGTRLGMLGTSPQVYNSYVDKFVPYFVEYSNAKSIDDALYNAEVQLLNSSNRNNIDYNLLASSAIIFNKLKLNNLTLDYTLQTPSFSNAQYSYLASIITGSMISNDPVVSLVNLIDNAYLSYLTGGNYYINMTIQQFPTYFNVDNIKATVTNIMGILIYPFAFSLLLPSFIHDIVLEKQERLRELMKMMGMKMYMYWLLTWTFDVFLFALVFITLLIIGAAWTLNFFLSPGALFLLILAWGFTLIGMSFLISTFLSRNRTITTFAIYLLIIIGIFVAFGMNLYYGSDKHFPAYLMIYPPFAFYRGLYLISSKCTSHCYTVSQIGGTEISTAIGYLWVEGIIFYILAFYCDKVLPQMFGIRKHPLFFIIEPYQYFKNKNNNNFTSELLLGEIKEDEHEDEDVREERLRILKGNTKDPIIIENLTKIYDDAKKKIAVDRLFLTIKENETFGLLGPNGAGKTTTISMLTGLFAPSSGTAKICGYDIVKEINKVHMVIGICPQFDVQWPTLTVEEHLLFYARLKGVERSQEKSAVIEVATRVGLQGDLVKKSAALSGGMKRRLSVAMALIGNPSIVFLDEPSSGLDPTSRRNLWEVIDYYKNGRSIILTTHSMEEADTLCTRIGIIAKGKLQCIGSPVHLKNKFGKGYSLFVNYNKDHVTEASNYIDKLLGGKYDIVNSVGTYRIYRVDKDSVHVSKILKEIESNRESVGIEDWGLSQTSLEEVFLSICREQEADQNEQK